MRISDWSSDVCSSDLKFESKQPSGEETMNMLVTAIAIAAATPVAAQTADAVHYDHGTPAPERSAKDCCCCDSPAANKADAMKKMACCEKASGDTPAGQHPDHHQSNWTGPKAVRYQSG